MEKYTDRQAAEALKTRIDFKYALSLELTDPGFDFPVLSEFRSRSNSQTRKQAPTSRQKVRRGPHLYLFLLD